MDILFLKESIDKVSFKVVIDAQGIASDGYMTFATFKMGRTKVLSFEDKGDGGPSMVFSNKQFIDTKVYDKFLEELKTLEYDLKKYHELSGMSEFGELDIMDDGINYIVQYYEALKEYRKGQSKSIVFYKDGSVYSTPFSSTFSVRGKKISSISLNKIKTNYSGAIPFVKKRIESIKNEGGIILNTNLDNL